MAYGIDSTLQDKVNAFRGQPQQLMQQYGQSQQLVDLLALQQIKSEKEAAARQIQMAMAQKQGQPTTIAQQREQEVMGLTRNEIAKQVQQGMPQQPQAPQQAPQQGPQGGGISALPAPNMQGMQNMAGGGIVAFAGTEGSDVPNPDDENIAKVMRLRPELSKEQAAALAAQLPKSGTTIGQLVKAGGQLVKAGLATVAHPLTPFTQADPVGLIMQADPRLTMDEARIIAQPQGIASLRAEAEGDLGNQGSANPTTAPATRQTMADAASTGIISTNAPPETGTDADTGEQTTAPAYSGPMGKGISSLARPTVATVDREGIRKGIASEYDNMPGLAELNKQRTDVANQLAQVYAKQNDPERQRQEKIHAFLSGLSHGATAASGLGLASEGVAETGKAQEAAKVTQIKELQANVEVRAKELMEMGFKRSDAMAKAVDEAQKNAISLYGHDVTRYGDEMRDREALARLLQDRHTDTTRYADEYVKAARARGDRSPESALRAKAMLEFNTARANTAAGTQLSAQASRQDTDAYNKAVDIVTKDPLMIGKSLLEKQDAINKLYMANPLGTGAALQAAPGAGAPTNPTGAPYPDGTHLTGPDGKAYVVKNGQPVLTGQ